MHVIFVYNEERIHSKDIKSRIKENSIMKSKITDVERFRLWTQSRTSYTLRGFCEKSKGCKSKTVVSNWKILCSTTLFFCKTGSTKDFCSYIVTKAYDEKIINNEERNKLIKRLEHTTFPTINFVVSNITCIAHIVECANNKISIMIEFTNFSEERDDNSLPSLQWIMRKSTHEKNIDTINVEYHDIRPIGKYVTQPRMTSCYGKSYKFSGSTQKINNEMPEKIENMINFINLSAHLPKEAQVNMCLVNHYNHGRHCIGEHSDNESSMLSLKDVYCFCEGMPRELIIRKKKDNTAKKRELLKIMISEGLYIMHGENFQKKYTHEFPEVFPGIFKKLQKILYPLEKEFPDYPRNNTTSISDKGANRLHLLQADWIANHSKILECLL
jgi:alkylated DNA repair dioxygenase AlkB